MLVPHVVELHTDWRSTVTLDEYLHGPQRVTFKLPIGCTGYALPRLPRGPVMMGGQVMRADQNTGVVWDWIPAQTPVTYYAVQPARLVGPEELGCPAPHR